MIHEIKQQLDNNPPDAIICVVGGGGLLNGVIMGLQDVGWPNVPVIAVETHGSNSFQASVVAGKLVTLDHISTIATSLGAKTVSSKSLELSLVHDVVPFAVSDAMAAEAVCLFADDHRFLVEAACGAGLSVCYTSVLRDILPNLQEHSNVVVIVCGGSNVSVDVVASYRKRYANPPIIVRSGSEVFLKLGDGGTGSMDVNLGEMGVGIGGEPEMGAEATMEAEVSGAGTEVEVASNMTAGVMIGETEARTDAECRSVMGVEVVEGERAEDGKRERGENGKEPRIDSRTDVKMEEQA
ncbi:tryptophan synthase beta subunit-like PLP-dependent enzyme [Endogone sp. FLAS-F59071]|nr:tryptophan synthase beta subunit-like PLP-dependent enzyme [Endogone sp. FLAS-F59071]|eukprot:RUS20105.1 tryptophan synthase beta subunit-like PLP-dependent enzyme [Endogone sp. FLAS-F59071]